MRGLKKYYRLHKALIRDRLRQFDRNYKKSDKEIFSELCFCILTPQAEALECDSIIRRLKDTGLLFNGTSKEIMPYLRPARFLNKKADFIVKARRLFEKRGAFHIKDFIDRDDISSTREWFVKNVKGIGYKEASHFLRNIGLGRDLAILDSHILKNLKRYSVIEDIPKTMSKKRYIEIENKMRSFSRKIKIPLAELDLLLWAKETGFIFK